MFAGRSSASKTHVLYTLLGYLFLIVLDIDHVTSMSLDKLVVERNEIGQDLPLSVENSESLALSAKTENSDEYVMLPGSQEEFERNTIEDNGSVGAEQDASDMLMMETNESPAIAVMQLPEAFSKETDTQNVETVERLVANENKMVANTPIALMLANLAQQQNAVQAEKVAEVEETAADLAQDAPQVVDSTGDVVAREQEAEVASVEEDSDSESVAEMILEAVEGMQEALENENKINADITAQEEELEKEAENEILGDAIQDEIAEAAAAQSDESKEPLEEQLENQVAADVGETVLGDLEATIDELPSLEYVDPEDGVMNAVMEALTPDDSFEDQEVAASEVDSVPEAVVESILPGNLVSNKLFIEEPTHNAVHDEEKPQQVEKNEASSESEPMAPLNTAQSEFSEVEPEEAEALMEHDEEFDAEEAGEEPMENMMMNEEEEVLKVSEGNQDDAAHIAEQSQNQVQVPEKSEAVVENQVQPQEQKENLVVAENQEQVQALEENLASENQEDMDSEDHAETELIDNNLDQAQTQTEEESQELSELLEEVEAQAQTQTVEENSEPVQVQEETQAVKEKLEEAETQEETQAVEENQKQPQVQEDTQTVEEVLASEETQVVEENQQQTPAQENQVSLQKLEQTEAQEGNGALEESQKESQDQEESQSQEENQAQKESQETHEESLDVGDKQEQSQEESQYVIEKLDQADDQEDFQTVPESVQMQVQDLVQDQAQVQEESLVILENQEQAEVQQVKIEQAEVQEEQLQEQGHTQEQNQDQALLQEVNPEDVEIQSEKIENPEKENQQQELNNNEESVQKENVLNINLVDLFPNEKVPDEDPQNPEEQQSENVKKNQLAVFEKENEETTGVMAENEEPQKLEEVPQVEKQHEEEEVQMLNESTIAIEKEDAQEINEPTIELEQLEELEHNSVENLIENEDKVDESPIEAQQEEAEQIIANEEQEDAHKEDEPMIKEYNDQPEPEKEAEPMIEEQKENQEKLQEPEKENVVEQVQQEEQTIPVPQKTESSTEEQHQEEEQSVQANAIETIPQVVEQTENEPSSMSPIFEEQTIPQDVSAESQSPEEELADIQVQEEVLPFADNIQVPQDEDDTTTEKISLLDVSQEVNENEESANAVVPNDVVPHVEAEIPVEPLQQDIATEQNEAESLDLVAQTTDDKTQEVQKQEPVKIEEELKAEEEPQKIVKITEIEAKPEEAAEIEEPAQTQEQINSNIVATEQVGDVATVDADKAENVEEPQPLDNQNSMLTTIVQVPQLQQPQEIAVQPIQADVVEEVATKVEIAAEEQKPMPISSISNTMIGGPLDVMDSVLNYVNASFINNNNNKQKLPINNDEFNSQLRRYDGAQVWRIVVQNDRDKKLVDELQTKYDAQLWKEVKSEVDYLLKPQVLADAEKYIRRANLSRIVLIDNLQKVIEVENPPAEEIAQLQNRKGHRMTWKAYHRLEDIHGFFDYLAKTYPDICSVETIGYSIEKRALKILKISNGNAANPGIWMDGGMHAREWISPASVTFIANQLVEGWDDLPAYMRNINWYIHAVANPDGYEYTHTTDRLWRKNMRSHGRQCPGVDLNRNFGYKWGGKGTSANPCAQTYRGSKAFSEPETFYISKFISNFPRETFQAYLSFHSYGQYILYPWGFDYQHSNDHAELDLVARQAGTTITRSSGIKYTVGASATTLYPAAGGSDDWAKGIAGIKYAFTIEMGDTGRYGFVLPASMIEMNGKDGFTFVETVARAVTHQDQDIRRRALYKHLALKSL